MRFTYHPPSDTLNLAAVLFALSDPIRLHIVRRLDRRAEQACNVFSEVAGAPPIPKSTLTHHFKVLRECGLIAIRNHGTQRLMSLRRPDLDQRFPGLLTAILSASNTSDDTPQAA